MTTKGDLIATNGSSINRLGIGTNTHVLQADSTATNGFKWGQVATAGIADGAVTSAKILDGTIALADLATAVANALVPVGTIVATARTTAPTGWLMCDGTSTTGYTTLASYVGATTPDMRGLFPIGKTAAGTGSTLLGTGGSTTITTSNMPSHTHTQDAHAHDFAGNFGGSSAAGINVDFGGPGNIYGVGANYVQISTAVNQNTGGGTAYYQPFIALNYIIKHD
jgi:microcystin-dependent protein